MAVNLIKTFQFKDEKFGLIAPSIAVQREAKFRFNKTFTSSIKDGFFTKKKLEAHLRAGEYDVIEDHNQKRGQLLQSYEEIRQLLERAEKEENPDNLEYLANMMQFYRNSLIQEDMALNSLFSATADNFAEDDRLNYLTFSIVRKESGDKVWNTYEDFTNDENFEFLELCKFQVVCWEYKLNPEWQKDLEETKALDKATELRTKQSIEKQIEAEKSSKKQKKVIKEKISKKVKKTLNKKEAVDTSAHT